LPSSSSIATTVSSSSGGDTSSNSKSCSRSGWCLYSPGNCHEMPTDDCCANGQLFANKAACNTTVKYCNMGRCEGGSGWNCSRGGCYPLSDSNTETNCRSYGGEVVSCCPAIALPPNADYQSCYY
jgi:hypothetical protein